MYRESVRERESVYVCDGDCLPLPPSLLLPHPLSLLNSSLTLTSYYMFPIEQYSYSGCVLFHPGVSGLIPFDVLW